MFRVYLRGFLTYIIITNKLVKLNKFNKNEIER